MWNVSTVNDDYAWPATAPIRSSPAITGDGNVMVKAWPHAAPGQTQGASVLFLLSGKSGQALWVGNEQYQSTAPIAIDGTDRYVGVCARAWWSSLVEQLGGAAWVRCVGALFISTAWVHACVCVCACAACA